MGWQFSGVLPQGQDDAVELRWESSKQATGAARLRICVLDTREAYTPIEVSLLDSGRVLGQFDLRWMAEFQVSEIRLDAADAASTLRRGVRLRQTGGTSPVWILTGSGSGPVVPAALRPHLLFDAPTDPLAEYCLRMDSLACVQAFGWMAGCVLDGLHDLESLPAISTCSDPCTSTWRYGSNPME